MLPDLSLSKVVIPHRASNGTIAERKRQCMVRGVVSARNGSFTLKNVKKGSYLLHITFIGYDPLYQPCKSPERKIP